MKTNKTITLTLAAILSAALLVGCQKASFVKLSYEDSLFQSKDADLSYRYTTGCYEPVSVGDPFAYCDNPAITLHEIPGLDPERFLTEEYAGAATTILYEESFSMPDLAELDPGIIYICLSGDRVFNVATVKEEMIIESIVDIFTTGEEADWPLLVPSRSYDLKFLSGKKLPGIYYNLVYGEFAEGNFLYNESTGRCVEVGSLISDIMEEEVFDEQNH